MKQELQRKAFELATAFAQHRDGVFACSQTMASVFGKSKRPGVDATNMNPTVWLEEVIQGFDATGWSRDRTPAASAMIAAEIRTETWKRVPMPEATRAALLAYIAERLDLLKRCAAVLALGTYGRKRVRQDIRTWSRIQRVVVAYVPPAPPFVSADDVYLPA